MNFILPRYEMKRTDIYGTLTTVVNTSFPCDKTIHPLIHFILQSMPLKFFSIEFTKGNEERLTEDSVLNFRYNSSSEGNYAFEKKARTVHRCQ